MASKQSGKTAPIQNEKGGSGGVKSAAMKQYGRNVARAMNQKGGAPRGK